jgi:hypothetical protein
MSGHGGDAQDRLPPESDLRCFRHMVALMNTAVVPIPTSSISDWSTFHAVFAEALGFPSFYGANMDAWIDCLTYADEPEAQMVAKAVRPGELLTLTIDDAADFAARCPDQFRELLECTAFVNYRRVELGKGPVLSLLISGYF